MRRPFIAALLALAASLAHAGEVQVAVAANFAGPLARIGEGFTAATGHVLKISAGATGKFYTQVISGAPFEVLIAADDETPKKLAAEGHAVAGTNFTYAIGKLVLWSAQPGYVDDQGAVLTAGNFAHLAIANPKLAPTLTRFNSTDETAIARLRNTTRSNRNATAMMMPMESRPQKLL